MYFGSVRFFKHLYITILILIVLIPLMVVIVLGFENSDLKQALQSAKEQLTEANTLVSVKTLAATTENEEAPEKKEPAFSYQTLYPDLYVTAPTVAVKAENTVYLTFDDGPSNVTSRILDTLKASNVKATFFVVGNNLNTESGQELLKRMVDEGHTIGVHTYSHAYATIYNSVESYLDDFDKVFQQVYEITGVYPSIFRFPGGSINGYNGSFYQQLIAEMERRGFVYYDWNVSSEDATGSASAAAITRNVVQNTANYSRAIVLMHDSSTKRTTADALQGIISALQIHGYNFAPLTNNVAPIIFSYKD